MTKSKIRPLERVAMTKNKAQVIDFWIGTEAELIKVFPVILELEAKNQNCSIISTGQNPIWNSPLLKLFKATKIVKTLSTGPKKKTSMSLLFWFISTFFKSLAVIDPGANRILVVHGDTISTMMGAVAGWIKRYQIAHVEAGLRSFNYFKPFPEEIDRVITSIFVDYHFCPNQSALQNLGSRSGEKTDTLANTLLDSLNSYKKISGPGQSPPFDRPYFVFVLHRQENLFDLDFVNQMVEAVISKSNEIPCVFILHEPTEAKLKELNKLDQVLSSKNIKIFPRLPYFEFMQILTRAEFLITDGGSNQEEAFYMGLPCLVMRTETERNEGLNHNVILERKNLDKIKAFFQDYNKFRKEPLITKESPSLIIAEKLISSL